MLADTPLATCSPLSSRAAPRVAGLSLFAAEPFVQSLKEANRMPLGRKNHRAAFWVGLPSKICIQGSKRLVSHHILTPRLANPFILVRT